MTTATALLGVSCMRFDTFRCTFIYKFQHTKDTSPLHDGCGEGVDATLLSDKLVVRNTFGCNHPKTIQMNEITAIVMDRTACAS
jgi:hypothetical protein